MHLDLNAHEGPEDFTLPVEVRVKNGMMLLDEKHGPGWVWRIDVDTLALASTCRCVLGQVYGDYGDALDVLGLFNGRSAEHGFTLTGSQEPEPVMWVELTTAWRHAILARRLDNPPTTEACEEGIRR